MGARGPQKGTKYRKRTILPNAKLRISNTRELCETQRWVEYLQKFLDDGTLDGFPWTQIREEHRNELRKLLETAEGCFIQGCYDYITETEHPAN